MTDRKRRGRREWWDWAFRPFAIACLFAVVACGIKGPPVPPKPRDSRAGTDAGSQQGFQRQVAPKMGQGVVGNGPADASSSP
ncbi:MAG: lipoprotein [Candidatus Methylomirabilales bacterium]